MSRATRPWRSNRLLKRYAKMHSWVEDAVVSRLLPRGGVQLATLEAQTFGRKTGSGP